MSKILLETEFSQKGIRKLINELEQYKNFTLPQKLNRYIIKLSNLGIRVMESKIEESPLGKYVSINLDISSDLMGTTAVITAIGETKEAEGYEPFYTILAIEFGAGIHHNPAPNPKADDLGFGVGTFPGKIHSFEDGWFYWDEKAGEWRYTHGVKATMPMYSASMEIISEYVRIAREVFK